MYIICILYLFLGVNHERPASTPSYQDSIFCGHTIPGQPILVPLADLVGVGQRVGDGEISGNGDFEVLALLNPPTDQLWGVRGKSI